MEKVTALPFEGAARGVKPTELEEIIATIKALPFGKAPGANGLNTDFFMATTEILPQTLKLVYSTMWKAGDLLALGVGKLLECFQKRIETRHC